MCLILFVNVVNMLNKRLFQSTVVIANSYGSIKTIVVGHIRVSDEDCKFQQVQIRGQSLCCLQEHLTNLSQISWPETIESFIDSVVSAVYRYYSATLHYLPFISCLVAICFQQTDVYLPLTYFSSAQAT